MKNLLNKGMLAIESAAEKAISKLSSGISLVTETVNGLPITISLEKSATFMDEKYDEKHYFIVPFVISDVGFALHTMRCLPHGIPEINQLPKRRIFHFPNEHSEAALKAYMLESTREIVTVTKGTHISSLESLANGIDELDKKLGYGMLLVGGMAAIFNPLLGAGIAAKSLLPGIATLLNKHGLRPVGEKLSKAQLTNEVRKAEEKVAAEFSASTTIKVVNPVLQELEYALRTDEKQHDPLIDPNFAKGNVPELNNTRWRELTETAVYHIYRDVYECPSKHKDAGLGPEDIRWLKTLFEGIKS